MTDATKQDPLPKPSRNLTAYAQQVRKWGGERPYDDADGQRRKIKHQVKVAPDAIAIDSAGNILVQPLLEGVPCFGRVERYCRSILEGRDEDRWPEGCAVCANEPACGQVVLKRLEAAPTIAGALEEWQQQTAPASGRAQFRGRNRLAWHKFLAAIEAHGGWTSSNDAAVQASAIARAEQRQQRRRALAAAARRAKRKSATAAPTTLTGAQVAALDTAYQHLHTGLVALAATGHAPPWIGRLTPEGCQLTAAVWRAKTWLQLLQRRPTGQAISELLITHGQAPAIRLESLRTKVYVVLKRLEKIERFAPTLLLAVP